MSCTQANIFLSNVKFGVPRPPSCSSYAYASQLSFSARCRGETQKSFTRLVLGQSKYRKIYPVCLATGNSTGGNKGFPWQPSNDGNDGGQRGGGAAGNGDGGQDEQNFSETMDEVLQVVLATIGFIFVYAYLLTGAEMTRLARDYIKYLFGSPATPRMMRTREKWADFFESLTGTVEGQKVLLGRLALAVPILLQNPRKLVELMRPGDY